jgi:hypothetical protein
MAYRIEGLPPEPFRALFALPDEALAERRAVRVIADSPTGYPCRVTLEDAAPGDPLMLVNHVSHDVETPFRTAYGIYVREEAVEPARYEDQVPAMLDRRTLGLRGFDAAGMLKGALLAMPGEADARIRELFGRPEIATVHAHNAAYGCFLARIERN